jgi:alpha-ketoglutarate-dependent taurine dioxygenase
MEIKNKIQSLKLNVGNVQEFINYYNGEKYVPKDITGYRPNLVHTNALGITGLFFSWTQTHFIENMPKDEGRDLIKYLQHHCENEKYIYNHDWEDGDIVISDQWLSIHKRWEFQHMDKRVLHRIACDYSNIFN